MTSGSVFLNDRENIPKVLAHRHFLREWYEDIWEKWLHIVWVDNERKFIHITNNRNFPINVWLCFKLFNENLILCKINEVNKIIKKLIRKFIARNPNKYSYLMLWHCLRDVYVCNLQLILNSGLYRISQIMIKKIIIQVQVNQP